MRGDADDFDTMKPNSVARPSGVMKIRSTPPPAPTARPASGVRPLPNLAELAAKALKRDSGVHTAPGTVLHRPAAEVCKHLDLAPQAKRLLENGLKVGGYLEVLKQHHLFDDAVRVLAGALPKREAVWWACQCVRSTAGEEPPAETLAGLEAAENWVKDPTEDHRRAAQAVAEASAFGSPAGAVALAAFWSGGSLAPAGTPLVAPADHLTGEGVASAVLLAAAEPEADEAPERCARFLAEGLDVANGLRRWKPAH